MPNEEKAQRTDALAKARETVKAHGIQRKTPAEKARECPKSLRKAVTFMCWDCQGGDADPCVQWRIGNCEITDCPLWHVRPWQRTYRSEMPKSLKTQSEN